ncbi:MAG: acyl-CoA dehydrogenase [Bradyrhizobium sp.]|nr:acyl-CoA dehydrogenase [Bradyrhizobium sp.]
MDLEWSADDVLFREEVRVWLTENLPGETRPAGTSGADFDRAWQKRLFAGGWAGINWPSEYGGRGLDLTRQMIWFEENAKAGAPSLGTLFVAQAHAGPTLIALGTEQQKARHLSGILRGDEIWCQGFSEPGSGSDLASLRARGTVDGDDIVVSGQKIWTSFADVADYQELLVRTEPGSTRHAGLSWVICDMKAPGITVHPIRKMNGDAEFCSVFYDEVRIPAANVVGAIGQGWATAMATLGFERGTAFIGEMVTLLLRLERLIEYAKTHPLAGATRPAWRDDAVRRRLSMHRAEVAALRALNYANLSRYAHGATPGAEGSLVRLFTVQLSQAIERAAIDIMGPALLDPEGAEQQWMSGYLHAIIHGIGGGTSDIQREIIADRVLGLPRSR